MAIMKEPRRPERSSPGRRLLAVGVSFAVHIALATALFGAASGRDVGSAAQGVDAGTMVVTIVNRRRAPADVAPAEAGVRLKPLLAKFDTNAVPIEVDVDAARTSKLDRLLARVRREQRPSAIERKSYAPSTDESSREGLEQQDALASIGEVAEGGEAQRSGEAGIFWGRVAPCWRRLGVDSRVGVTLEVSLDGQGRISRPPRIVRARTATAGETRLRAEAQALAALAACAPQADGRLANRVFTLEFPPSSP